MLSFMVISPVSRLMLEQMILPQYSFHTGHRTQTIRTPQSLDLHCLHRSFILTCPIGNVAPSRVTNEKRFSLSIR